MAADVVKFTFAIDKAFKDFSTQEVQFETKEVKGMSNREAMQYMEKKFQKQLQRARAAFLQEFRNHSVVTETEVKKIREELTERMEEKYGGRIGALKEEAVQASKILQKHKEEIAKLKSVVASQECYLDSVRDRLRQEETQREEIQHLQEELGLSKQENSELTHQLMSRGELVAQLNNELSGLEALIKRQVANFTDERGGNDAELLALRREMAEQQEHFRAQLQHYETGFEEYKQKTMAELHIQDILNARRSEALQSMEGERQLHIKARTKPSRRIGDSGAEERDLAPEMVKCTDYPSAPAQYRVDDMGMDTSWRDYALKEFQFVPPVKKVQLPKFRVERMRKSAQLPQRGAANLGPQPSMATDTPRDREGTPRETPRQPPGSQLEIAAAPLLPTILLGPRGGAG